MYHPGFELVADDGGCYLELRAAGVDQFSVSLDFPDERHDEFRLHPGLFKHLSEIVPRLARLPFGYA